VKQEAAAEESPDTKTEAAGYQEMSNFANEPDPVRRRKLYRTLVVSGVLVLSLVAGGIGAYLSYGRVAAPDLVGLSSSEAIDALNGVGLKVGELSEEEVPGVSPGLVVNQEPMVDTALLRGSAVDLTVSKAAAAVLVPDLTGKTLEDAKRTLSDARLSAQELSTFSDTVPAGSIVGFLPTAGTELPSGSTVSVLVSSGAYSTPVELPRLIGLGQSEAEELLRKKGFNPVVYHASTSFGNLDEVVAQTPASRASAPPASVVMLLVSRGNSTTELSVPKLIGKTRTQAEQEASDAGFPAEVYPIADSKVASGTVVAQAPPAEGSLLGAGDPLGLLVSHGASTDAVVPTVLSMETSAAALTLRAAGFVPQIVPRAQGAQASAVTQQFPASTTAYKLGLPVLLYAPEQ
jgi:serine/threonine-protein kinase